MIGSTKLYILVSVWMTLTSIQGHSCTGNQNFVHFLVNFVVDLDEIQCVTTTWLLVAAHAKFILLK